MIIPYNTESGGFKETISNSLKENSVIFSDFGKIKIELEADAAGYSGEVRATIHPDLDEGFGSDWPGEDPTRFPARIRAAASALKDNGFKDDWMISHNDGTIKIQKPSSQSDWNEDEVLASVEAYTQMHQMDTEGKSFNKAVINRQLRADRLSARNRSSIEFSMCNISSVFTEMGVDYLKGYRPAENVGANVREAIADAVEKTGYLKGKGFTPTANYEVLEQQTRTLRSRTFSKAPEGTDNPEFVETTTKTYKRDPSVKAWVLKEANGICELCNFDAPFRDANGFPYLEVHHVHPLGKGGADVIENAVALCPNCHKACHHSSEAAELANKLYDRVGRLNR